MVSVDPDRDTSEILQKYVRSFGENVSGVTGKNEELDKLTSQLGIFYKANKHEGENYSVNHSAAVILINKNAEFHAVFSAPHSIEHFVSDLPLLLKES
jgi:protein SCO1/2